MQIAEQIQAAEAKLAKLQRACEDAEAERNKSELAYAAHRDPELFVAKQVAADLAADAALAVTGQARAIEQLREQLRAEQHASLVVEAETARAAALARFDAAADQLIAAAQAFDGAISQLAGYHKTQLRCGGPSVSLAQICSNIQARFGAIRDAGQYQDHAHMTRDARVRFANVGGTNHFLELVLVRPAAIPSSLW